jgi:hypothetical protein
MAIKLFEVPSKTTTPKCRDSDIFAQQKKLKSTP